MFNWLAGSNMLVLLQPYKFGMVEMTISQIEYPKKNMVTLL